MLLSSANSRRKLPALIGAVNWQKRGIPFMTEGLAIFLS